MTSPVRAVGDHRPLAEIHLRALADGEIEHHRRLRRRRPLALEEAVHRVHAAAVAVVAHQSPVHGRGLDALGMPGEQLLPKRLDAGEILRWTLRRPEPGGQARVVGHRAGRVKPAALRRRSSRSAATLTLPTRSARAIARSVSPNRSR